MYNKLIPLLFAVSIKLTAQEFNYVALSKVPLMYSCMHISSNKIICDGKPDEPDWEKANWTTLFTDISGEELPEPYYDTRVKMLWDDESLYVAAILKEEHIWAYQNKRDDIIYRENDFELFISGDIQNPEYYEIEINALNNILDLLLAKPYRDRGKPDLAWNAKGLQTGINLNGTINDGKDLDKEWTIEMKIPFSALDKNHLGKAPNSGEFWRINFSRVQYETEFINGKYFRKRDINHEPIAEHNWVWSQQGLIDMHFPERWGYVQFLMNEQSITVNDKFSRSEELKRLLWLIYYRQRSYFKEHKKYASTLAQLNYPEFLKGSNIQTEQILLEGNSTEYRLVIDLPAENLHLSLDQSGNIR
jgi:hypothetical protein